MAALCNCQHMDVRVLIQWISTFSSKMWRVFDLQSSRHPFSCQVAPVLNELAGHEEVPLASLHS